MSGLAGAYDLKDEAQAKEYLDKVGIEYRFQCYHEKLPEGCHRLATFLETIRKDVTKARKVFHTNCEENKHGQSCYKYGNFLLAGEGGEKDSEGAYASFKKGCEYGSSYSCHNAGLMQHTLKNYTEAVAAFDKACGLDNDVSCYFLSGYYITGKGVEKDMQKAFEYSKVNCDKRGHAASCANVSRMYDLGDGVAQDKDLANKYKKITIEKRDEMLEFQKTLKFGGIQN